MSESSHRTHDIVELQLVCKLFSSFPLSQRNPLLTSTLPPLPLCEFIFQNCCSVRLEYFPTYQENFVAKAIDVKEVR